MMSRSHFDFIEKPERNDSPKKFSKVSQAKDKISKAFLKLNREKNFKK